MTINGRPVHVSCEGSGEAVICIHAAGSSGMQWHGIRDKLKDRYQVILPDLYGEGKTPALEDWSTLLDDETALVSHLVDHSGGSAHLVGHSYGGVLAIKLALNDRYRIKSITVIEPVAFNLLDDHAGGIQESLYEMRDACLEAMSNNDLQTAAQLFYSFWKGDPHSWHMLPKAAQCFMAGNMQKIMTGWQAIINDTITMDDIATISVPALIVSGSQSPATTRWICSQLARNIPGAKFQEINGGGHMSPITHPEAVNEVVLNYIDNIETYTPLG